MGMDQHYSYIPDNEAADIAKVEDGRKGLVESLPKMTSTSRSCVLQSEERLPS